MHSRYGVAGAAMLLSLVAGRVEAQQAPTLVVFIAVDQLREDYLDRFAPQLTGGLGRLYRGGAFFTNAHHDHAITETAPGHSAMLSGRLPFHTGIVTNSRGVPDSKAPLIGGGGPGASPARFRGTVLFDWMHERDPRARALSVSRKDRGAILPLGKAKQNVFWYASDGRFTTSTYYADTLPAWVQRFNARKIPQSYAGTAWTLLLPPSEYPERDTVFVENWGADQIFPHLFPADPVQAAKVFPNYPSMDSLTAQMALEGVAAMKLGAGPQTDLLSVSFSSTDAVGHAFGPDSRELHDQIVRLDRYMGAFIDSLYTLRDSTRIIFALTADHGVAPIPEVRAEREHVPAMRVDVVPTLREVVSRLAAAGIDSTPLRFEEGIISVNRRLLDAAHVNADSAVNAIAADLKKLAGVQRVDLVKNLVKADTTTDYVARRWYHMLPADFPADLVVTLVPYAYYAGDIVATHGTPYDYDTRVPVIFYGPGIKPGKHPEAAKVVDIAPTLAAWLKISPTEKLDGVSRLGVIR